MGRLPRTSFCSIAGLRIKAKEADKEEFYLSESTQQHPKRGISVSRQMKRSVRKRKTEEARTEAKNYIDFIESDFDRKLRDRMRFEQKYLKLDTTSD